jgi:hypothetical protein
MSNFDFTRRDLFGGLLGSLLGLLVSKPKATSAQPAASPALPAGHGYETVTTYTYCGGRSWDHSGQVTTVVYDAAGHRISYESYPYQTGTTTSYDYRTGNVWHWPPDGRGTQNPPRSPQ